MAKNTYGNAVTVTLFGESHGECVGVVLDGVTPGIPVDASVIEQQLALRRPTGGISTARREQDPWRIVSGVREGRTTGTPICILIPNGDTKSEDYATGIARPGHADYTAQCKYHGAQDARGGGHFSGRLTVGLVAAGAIFLPALRAQGIEIGTHIARLGDVMDAPLDAAAYGAENGLREQLRALSRNAFPTVCPKAAREMIATIEAAKNEGDSVGGVLETAIVGLPAGLGEPWFDSLESQLAHAMFSVPAVKGVSFGDGFSMTAWRGSQANDAFRIREGRVVTATNHNGGINGGISNGMPIVFSCAVKPTPSVAKEQPTVDFLQNKDREFSVVGRHDPCIVHRARAVVDALAAIVVADILVQRFGDDALREDLIKANPSARS